tara:strand:- start:7680 stop:9869 length:2190 start_codon:yes stop_codon:yes gene_type:complete
MTISIWRYSHFILAVVSSLFLLLASVTGVILAIEPIQHQSKGHAISNLDEVSAATAIESLQTSYDEVFALEVEPSGFVKASVLTADLETADLYVDPRTGNSLGVVPERPNVYRFTTNLHRSLFLKTTGRVFVGVVSLLLCLIAITGLLLLIKRQGGIRGLFSKVHKDYFEMRYHVVLSRWFFIPIIIVAITGVYLSVEKFGWLPKETLDHSSKVMVSDIPLLQTITLDEVRSIEFPFSEDPKEYFQLSLQDREIRVNQQTGNLISEASYPFVTIASRLSFQWHTGEGSVWWSIVLLLAGASIVFFMYSGFVMSWKRLKSKKSSVTMRPASEAEILVFVGSETGTTYDIATRFFIAAERSGLKLFMTELNAYSEVYKETNAFENIKQLVILTATYGEGEAPTNARKFETQLKSTVLDKKIPFSVVGFGSLEYPDYCQFASTVDTLLTQHPNFEPLLPLYKINNADTSDFDYWVQQWEQPLGLSLSVKHPVPKKKKKKERSFTVVQRTPLNVDDTFLLRLRPKRSLRFTSGDLLSFVPNGSETVRQYSIAKIDGDILLSIKKHEFGRASSQLFELCEGDVFEASVESNKHFHFPKHCKEAFFIANGTGIAPFLGMMATQKQATIHLYWGGRTKESLELYQPIINAITAKNQKVTLHSCCSREGKKEYVQELLKKDTTLVQQALSNDGVIMICGSLAMQHDVIDVLASQLKDHPELSLDVIEHQQQLKMDCY